MKYVYPYLYVKKSIYTNENITEILTKHCSQKTVNRKPVYTRVWTYWRKRPCWRLMVLPFIDILSYTVQDNVVYENNENKSKLSEIAFLNFLPLFWMFVIPLRDNHLNILKILQNFDWRILICCCCCCWLF